MIFIFYSFAFGNHVLKKFKKKKFLILCGLKKIKASFFRVSFNYLFGDNTDLCSSRLFLYNTFMYKKKYVTLRYLISHFYTLLFLTTINFFLLLTIIITVTVSKIIIITNELYDSQSTKPVRTNVRAKI